MQPIDLATTVQQPLPEARAQLLERRDPRLRGLGLTPHATANAVEYRPKVAWPIVWAVRRLQGERVTLTFEQQTPTTTSVQARGRLRDRADAELTEALGPR